MQQLIEKASVLIEALPYVQKFRNEIVVVKFGGSAMEDPAQVERVLADITFMECMGMIAFWRYAAIAYLNGTTLIHQ